MSSWASRSPTCPRRTISGCSNTQPSRRWARGGGVDAQLFEASRDLAGTQRVALVEVDADRGEEAQSRRLNFYRRLACRRLGGLAISCRWRRSGRRRQLWLLALAPADVKTLDVNLVERWVRSIYEDVYAQRLDDPRLARMIDPLPDRGAARSDLAALQPRLDDVVGDGKAHGREGVGVGAVHHRSGFLPGEPSGGFKFRFIDGNFALRRPRG